MKDLVRKIYHSSETKAVEGRDRTLMVRISTKNVDRSGDVVQPKGVVLDNYLRNPVVAQFHNYQKPAIAKTLEIQATDDGIMATLEFPQEGKYTDADVLYELYKGGFMNAWSVGFIPQEFKDLQNGGREFIKWELLEYSAVLVPDNPDALTMLRGKGIDVKPIEKDIKETEKKIKELDSKNEEKKEEMKEQKPETVEVTKELFEQMEVQIKELKEIKEGRVLSEKNRNLVSSAIEKLNDTQSALEDLLKATEPKKENNQLEVEKNNQIEEALKAIDKIVGQRLRDLKAQRSGK